MVMLDEKAFWALKAWSKTTVPMLGAGTPLTILWKDGSTDTKKPECGRAAGEWGPG